jgi:hypothetical protein
VAVTRLHFRLGLWPAAPALAAAALAVTLTRPALAQAANPPPAAAAPAQRQAAPDQVPPDQVPPGQTAPASGLALPPQPPPPGTPVKRGFLNDFGQWWDDSVASFNAKMKEQQAKIDEFNKKSVDAAKDAATATQQAMKNAADAMVRLPTSRVIEIHELCVIAGNGAPDCAAAAANACHSKGFANGQPVDIRTAEKCNASLWMSGQNPATAECPVETVVLRAACE